MKEFRISFYTFNSSHLNFVFSLSEDGHMVGRNIYEVTVYTRIKNFNTLGCICLYCCSTYSNKAQIT